MAHRRRKSVGALTRHLILRGLLEESPADGALLIRLVEGRPR